MGGGMYVGNFDKVLFSPATFTAGLEYSHNNMHDVMTGYNRDLEQKVRIASAFFQNEWKMNDVTLLAGFRLDDHNLIENLIFSPRVNMLYKPSDAFQGRLTWSTGFRAPQAYDEDLHVTAVGGEGVLIRLADDLKPEKSNSFSGSVDLTGQIGLIDKKTEECVAVEAFYLQYENFADLFLDWLYLINSKGIDIQPEKFHGNKMIVVPRPKVELKPEEKDAAIIQRGDKFYVRLDTSGGPRTAFMSKTTFRETEWKTCWYPNSICLDINKSFSFFSALFVKDC